MRPWSGRVPIPSFQQGQYNTYGGSYGMGTPTTYPVPGVSNVPLPGPNPTGMGLMTSQPNSINMNMGVMPNTMNTGMVSNTISMPNNTLNKPMMPNSLVMNSMNNTGLMPNNSRMAAPGLNMSPIPMNTMNTGLMSNSGMISNNTGMMTNSMANVGMMSNNTSMPSNTGMMSNTMNNTGMMSTTMNNAGMMPNTMSNTGMMPNNTSMPPNTGMMSNTMNNTSIIPNTMSNTGMMSNNTSMPSNIGMMSNTMNNTGMMPNTMNNTGMMPNPTGGMSNSIGMNNMSGGMGSSMLSPAMSNPVPGSPLSSNIMMSNPTPGTVPNSMSDPISMGIPAEVNNSARPMSPQMPQQPQQQMPPNTMQIPSITNSDASNSVTSMSVSSSAPESSQPTTIFGWAAGGFSEEPTSRSYSMSSVDSTQTEAAVENQADAGNSRSDSTSTTSSSHTFSLITPPPRPRRPADLAQSEERSGSKSPRSPRASSPLISPRTSPKASPRSSPKVSPRNSSIKKRSQSSSAGTAQGHNVIQVGECENEEELIKSLSLVWQQKGFASGPSSLTGWKKANNYYMKKVKSKDALNFRKIMKVVFNCPDEIQVEEIQAVLNPGIIKDFNSYVKKITQRQKEKPELFKKMDWLAQADHATKKEVLSRYENLVKKFYWNNNNDKLPIIPVVHGTDLEVAKQICNTGFTTIASLYEHLLILILILIRDAGYYGQGMYFSTDIGYITPYFASKKNPCILFCFALPGNVYPVTEDPNAQNTLVGKPFKAGYHSHYARTNSNGLIYDPLNGDKRAYDELVLFQECQVIPAYIIQIKNHGLPKLLEKWGRENLYEPQK